MLEQLCFLSCRVLFCVAWIGRWGCNMRFTCAVDAMAYPCRVLHIPRVCAFGNSALDIICDLCSTMAYMNQSRIYTGIDLPRSAYIGWDLLIGDMQDARDENFKLLGATLITTIPLDVPRFIYCSTILRTHLCATQRVVQLLTGAIKPRRHACTLPYARFGTTSGFHGRTMRPSWPCLRRDF